VTDGQRPEYTIIRKKMNQQVLTTIVHEQLSAEKLIRQTLARQEGKLSDCGALCISTGRFTGRSPEDKFIVKDRISEEKVNWNKFNQSIEESSFLRLKDKMLVYLNQQPQVWARNVYACADKNYRLPIRVVNENPWSNLFVANMFIEPAADELKAIQQEWLVLHAPGFYANPAEDGTRNANFTILSFQHKTILIGGSGYTGEIKKAIFTALNFILPLGSNVLSMHCSVNEGQEGDIALFFGLSGTGKTTLSADGSRRLLGDDEHGWSDEGIFNFEGGCYAKIINLSAENEPEIYGAIRTGALVENAVMNNDRFIDYADSSITENTRASYPLSFITNAKIPSITGHPRNIFFLTCDAYGVLPPISRLNDKQVMYYFLNGYTAKIAGTETGIVQPKATFSACFGAPFLPLDSKFYATMLDRYINRYQVKVWLINTGWTAGPYGTGYRINIRHTRAMINAVLNGSLEEVRYDRHPVFGLYSPNTCLGVPTQLLQVRNMWADKNAYDMSAQKLFNQFEQNYALFNPDADSEAMFLV
jgi:phosphoenolpyruvate carboxykinase (ATP)